MLAAGYQQTEQKADCGGDTDRLPRIVVDIFVGRVGRFARFFVRVLFGRMQRVFDLVNMVGQFRHFEQFLKLKFIYITKKEISQQSYSPKYLFNSLINPS